MPRVEHGPDDLTIGLGYLARQAEAYPWAAAVDAEVERLRAALRDMLPGIDNLRGYRCAEQRAFLAHVESIERRVTAALSDQRATPDRGAAMTWKTIDPLVYRQGWDAALAGKARSACEFSGSGPRAAWNEGYDDALREREKDAPAQSEQEGRDA